jgi:hypothetical protein
MYRMRGPLPELLKAALKKFHPKDEINENID